MDGVRRAERRRRPGGTTAETAGEPRGSAIEVKVPDIGDFKDVPIIEMLVKPGDAVKAEDSLVTLETDKATMEVPSPARRHGRRS